MRAYHSLRAYRNSEREREREKVRKAKERERESIASSLGACGIEEKIEDCPKSISKMTV